MTLKPSWWRRWHNDVPMPPMPPVTYAIFMRGCPAGCRATAKANGQSLRRTAGSARRAPSSSLHAHRDAHPAADAQAGDPLLRAAPGHFVQQRDEDPAARRADRMADGDRAAVDVDLAGVPAHLVV